MAHFRKRGDKWYFRYVDAAGVERERRGCPDLKVTKELARAAEAEAADAPEEPADEEPDKSGDSDEDSAG